MSSPIAGQRAHTDRRELAAIFAGGVAGAVLRAALADALRDDATQWPWATFTANILGAFALGYVAVRLQHRLPPSSYRSPLLGTGFCGALTTFSTMQVELVRMLAGGAWALAAAYAASSIVLGLAAVLAGSAAAGRPQGLA